MSEPCTNIIILSIVNILSKLMLLSIRRLELFVTLAGEEWRNSDPIVRIYFHWCAVEGNDA
jgi:hypothetical protein